MVDGSILDIDPLQAISFINATIVAQLLWGAIWYVNAAKSNLKQIDSIIASAYKIALGLPRNSSNMVCWKFSNHPFFNSRVTCLNAATGFYAPNYVKLESLIK